MLQDKTCWWMVDGVCGKYYMNNTRIIPRLDVKGPNLVKGIHLEGLRVLGKPEQFAEYYYEHGADELMLVDVVASLYGRNNLQDIITRTAKKIFIPLTVSGGIRTLDDIKKTLRAGADKVSLNTAAINQPGLIQKASREFGTSTIVVTIEAIRQASGQYLAYTDNGREHTGIDVLEWAKKVEDLGAGEIVITSVDREGTGSGFDIELIQMVTDEVTVPVIAHGGAGNLDHIHKIIKIGKADAVLIASMLHYGSFKEINKANEYKKEGNIEFLKSGSFFSKINNAEIQTIKNFLHKKNILCRHDIFHEDND